MLSACSGTASKTSSKDEAQAPQQSPAQEFLNTYFDSMVKGGDGGEYWCSSSKSLQSSLYAVRSYRVLDFQELTKKDNSKAWNATVQVDSSNKGGTQITKNWSVYVEEEAGKPCIGLLLEK